MLAEQSTFKMPPSLDAIGDVFFCSTYPSKRFLVHIIFTLSTIVHVSEMPLVENGIRDVLLNKSKVINLTGAFRPAQHRHTPSNIWCWHCLKGILSLTCLCFNALGCFKNGSIFCVLVSAKKCLKTKFWAAICGALRSTHFRPRIGPPCFVGDYNHGCYVLIFWDHPDQLGTPQLTSHVGTCLSADRRKRGQGRSITQQCQPTSVPWCCHLATPEKKLSGSKKLNSMN